MKPSRSIDVAGFTMPEVMISSLLIAVVVINSAQTFIRSQSNINNTSLRDAAYARIAKDVEYLRTKAYKFGCEGLNDNGTPTISPSSPDPLASSCTGLSRDASKPLMYKSARMPAIAPYKTACETNHMGQALAVAYSLPGDSDWITLAWETSGITTDHLPSGISNVAIQRNIDPSDNELVITYKTTSESPIKIQLKTTLIPQALGWCP